MAQVIEEHTDDNNLAEHNTRLLEAETAQAYNISFDEAWYSRPVLARAQMIAGRIGRNWLNSLEAEEAAKHPPTGAAS